MLARAFPTGPSSTTAYRTFPSSAFRGTLRQSGDVSRLRQSLADRDGLWPAYRAFWKHVAERFKAKSNLLGYDLLNELARLAVADVRESDRLPAVGRSLPATVPRERDPPASAKSIRPHPSGGAASGRRRRRRQFGRSLVADRGSAATREFSFHVYALAALFGSTAVPLFSGPNDPVTPLNEALGLPATGSRRRAQLFRAAHHRVRASDSTDEIERVAGSPTSTWCRGTTGLTQVGRIRPQLERRSLRRLI